MSAHLLISAERAGMQLRRHIISTYRRAEEIIGRARSAPPSKMNALMQEYDKLCDRMQADIAQAGNFYPTTNALLAWLLDGSSGEIMPEKDRLALSLAVRTIGEKPRKSRTLTEPKDAVASYLCRGDAVKATDRERPIRRRIIRQWMTLPRDKRQTVEQIKEFTERAVSQHQFARSRRDPRQKIAGWLLPRLGRRRWNKPRNG